MTTDTHNTNTNSNQKKKVEIYSTPTCVYCGQAKDFFAANGIAFTNYDVSTDAAKRTEMIEKTGQMGVPVIVLTPNDSDNPEDVEIVIGFNKKHLATSLDVPLAA